MFKAIDLEEEVQKVVEEAIENAVEELQPTLVEELQIAAEVEKKVKRTFSDLFFSLLLGCSSAKTHVISALETAPLETAPLETAPLETAPSEPSQNNV